jgi:hypothetical protein
VLGARHQPVPLAVVAALRPLDARRPHDGVQVRILAGGLGDPASALVRDVDHRGVRLLEPDGGELARSVSGVVEGHLRIEARAGAERDGEDRPEAVDRGEREQQRDSEPRLLEGDPLELPDSRSGFVSLRTAPSPLRTSSSVTRKSGSNWIS